MIDSHLLELSPLNLVADELLASSGSTAVVLVASTGGLNHPQRERLYHIVCGENDAGSVRAVRRVDRLALTLEGDSLGKSFARNANTVDVLVLLGLLSGSKHEFASVGSETIHDLQLVIDENKLTDPTCLLME